MKRLLAVAALATFAVAPSAAFAAAPRGTPLADARNGSAAVFTIDPDHTTSGFEVTHLVVTKVRGQFGTTNGTIEIDDKDVTKSKVDVTIDATSITTGNEKRDAHLKSEDFFAADKYPQVTFKSTKVEKGSAKDSLKVTGDLTMRGVTKPVTLDVTYTGAEFKAPWGYSIRGASATGTLNRKDFGISWNKTFDGGGVTVSDTVKLMIEAEFNRPVEEPKPTN